MFIYEGIGSFVDSRSNNHLFANVSDDDFIMDSQVIDEESRMPSVAPLNGSSERQVISEKSERARFYNLSDERYSSKRYTCNICGHIFQSYSTLRNHKVRWLI